MQQPSETPAAPPPLRIVRRRTIDVDQDAAGMVAAAHGGAGSRDASGYDLVFKALAMLAVAAVGVAVLTIW